MFHVAKEKSQVSGVNSGGGVFSSVRSLAAVVLSGGLTPWLGCHLDLFPVVSWPERNDGEVLRSPVNCFEFELGAPLETNNSFLGSSNRSSRLGGGRCVGGAPRTKVIRSSHLWKKLLEKFGVVLGRVFSRLGRKPKLFFGFRLGAGCKAKFSVSSPGSESGWVAVKPKGFWVKSKLKLMKACDVGPAKGLELVSESGQVSRSDLDFGSVQVSRPDLDSESAQCFVYDLDSGLNQ